MMAMKNMQMVWAAVATTQQGKKRAVVGLRAISEGVAHQTRGIEAAGGFLLLALPSMATTLLVDPSLEKPAGFTVIGLAGCAMLSFLHAALAAWCWVALWSPAIESQGPFP